MLQRKMTVITKKELIKTLDLLRPKKITVWRAAEIVGVSYREFLDILKEHDISFPISEEELLKEFDEI